MTDADVERPHGKQPLTLESRMIAVGAVACLVPGDTPAGTNLDMATVARDAMELLAATSLQCPVWPHGTRRAFWG